MQFDQDMCKNFGKQNSTLGSVVPLAMFYSSFRGAAGDTDLNFRKVSTSGSGLLPTPRFISSAANAVAPEKTDKHFKEVVFEIHIQMLRKQIFEGFKERKKILFRTLQTLSKIEMCQFAFLIS